MKGMLLGAGLGAGVNMLRGKDPLQGAMMGGALGGIGSGLSTMGAAGASGAASGAGAGYLQGAPHLVSGATLSNPFSTGVASEMAMGGKFTPNILTGGGNAVSNSGLLSNMMSGNTPLDKMISTGFEKGMGLLNEHTGLTQQDVGKMALGQGISALSPEKQQAINHQVGQIKEANYPVAQAPAGNLNVLGPQEAETIGLGTDPELIQKTLYEDPRYRTQRRIGQ
jgi:hypothetical protein